MTVELPFTVAAVLHGVREAFQLPENEPQVRPKPRASGIGNDAREIAYMMANTPPSNPFWTVTHRLGDAFTQEQGRLAEEITCGALRAIGIEVVDRQIELPTDYPVTGHPDGRLAHTRCVSDEDGECPRCRWFADGRVWGFEHKHLNAYPYGLVVKDGLWTARPDYIEQTVLYGDALGWDAVLFVITSQDGSTVRRDFSRKKGGPPSQHPKMMFIPIEMDDLRDLIPSLHARARWFSDWLREDGDPAHVAWETEPREDWLTAPLAKAFPWNYSDWVDRAIEDGPGHLKAPPLLLPRG